MTRQAQPVGGLKGLSVEPHYEGLGEQLSRQLIIPALRAAIRYDRLTSFFTTESLLACAEGIDNLWNRRGTMRLVLGIHSVPHDLATAASSPEWIEGLIKEAKANVIAGCKKLSDEVSRNRLGALAMMLRDGFLQVRVAIPLDVGGRPTGGILHSKRYIFTDAHGDTMVAVGSPNETGKALSTNFEELTVDCSWRDQGRAQWLAQSFAKIWEGARQDLAVRELDKGFAAELLKGLEKQGGQPSPSRPSDAARKVLALLRESPEFAFTNIARAALFPHQERALRDAVSRWPIRVLLADEVGLGKTIEAGSVVCYAQRFLGAKRILILTPAGLRRQWQSELLQHFGITAWRYESQESVFVGPKDEERKASQKTPLNNAPDVIIVSWQLARGPWESRDVFGRSDWKPDLILVDEAHSARRTRGLDKKLQTTLVWDMVKKLGAGCPHLVLLTATPMQIQIEEYHGLLMLLGMPEWWLDADRFIGLLASLEGFKSTNELAQTKQVAEGIAQGLGMYADPGFCLRPEHGLSLSEVFPPPLPPRKALGLMAKGDALKDLAVTSTPPAALTIRNTRRGLEALGYRFPKRVFHAPPLALEDRGIRFLRRINAFLDDAYGKAELALGISEQGATAFVRSIYYQRLVSSRVSAQRTLARRAARLESFFASGVWGDSDISDDELEGEAPAAVGLTPHEKARLDAAKQCARIELQYIKEMCADLEGSASAGRDPKIAAIEEIIAHRLAAGDSTLVFSRFTDTVDACIAAMGETVLAAGAGFGTYTGGGSSIHTAGQRIETDKAGLCGALRKGQIKVVFCSDAASEGLNLQSARCLINVDVPWNPARLEQRIGRIARLGQRAEEVEIHNLWYPGTVEEQMYSRLLSRQDLYSLAVGEFPDIVGEGIRSQLRSHQPPDFGDIEHRLNDLRSRAEMTALQRVWAKGSSKDSVGGEFRAHLFVLVGKLVSARGWPMECDNDTLSFTLGGEKVTFDARAGQEDSLTVQHSALDTLLSQSTTAFESVADRLAILCIGNRPTSLLLRVDEGYRLLGSTATLTALEVLVLGGVDLTCDGPLLTQQPSHAELLAALRTAFPARIEVGAIKVPIPNPIQDWEPLSGSIVITPLVNWTPA